MCVAESANRLLTIAGMAGLSLTTVVFSLLSDCPSFVFYILEVIVRWGSALCCSVDLIVT